MEFQSTYPSRGTTDAVVVQGDTLCISIHIPLAGYDSKNSQNFYFILLNIRLYYLFTLYFLCKVKEEIGFGMFLYTFSGANLPHFLCMLMVRTRPFYKINVSSAEIPLFTPRCSTFVL